ncbi:MAG: hypothetical protein U0736_13840 [Gemmataceae bacterium]
MSQPASNNNLIGFLAQALYRGRWTMAVFFTVCMAVVVAATYFSSRIYRSQAKLYVRLGRENATLDPTATLGQSAVVAVPPSRENELNSFLDILGSRILMDRVIDRLGIDVVLGKEPPNTPPPDEPPSLEERSEAIRAMLKRLDAEVVKRSNILLVSYQARSPETARAVVTALVDAFLEQHAKMHRAQGAYHFLAEQLGRVQKDLDGTEDRLRSLKEKTGLISVENQKQLLVTRIGRLEDELFQAETLLATNEAEVQVLRERLEKLPATQVTGTTHGLPNQALDTMKSQLYALELKELELTGKYPDNHPEVRAVRKQAEAARRLIQAEEKDREQVTKGPNRLHEEAQLALLRQEPQLKAVRMKVTALRAQLATERKALAELNRNELRIARLQRDYDLELAQHRKYAESMEQMQIDQALQTEKISNISVVQPATLDPLPIKPKWTTNLGIGLVLALAGSMSLAVLLESLDRTLRSPRQVAGRLQLPVLASIDRAASPASLPLTSPLLHNGCRHALSRVVWPEETLRRPRVIGVVGSDKGVGASTLAAGLAQAELYAAGEPILLVNTGRPGVNWLSELNGCPAEVGFHDVLTGKVEVADAIRPTSIHGMYVLPAGKVAQDTLWTGPPSQVAGLFDRLRERYAGIVVDLAADTPAALRRGLTAALDGWVLVIAEGQSTEEVAQGRLEEWSGQGARPLGVVVNRHRPLPGWLDSLAGEAG